MRHYQLYLLKEQVARSYFGREIKLFELFHDQSRASNGQRMIIDKQIEYISRPLPILLLQQKLTSHLKGRTDFICKNQRYYIELREPLCQAELSFSQNYLSLTSEGNIEAETIFFELLRKVDPCFFAVNLADHRFGWLNPIRQVKYI